MLIAVGRRHMTLGDFIKHRRARLGGMKQKELARLTAIDQSRLSRIEANLGAKFPGPDELARLAEALECTTDDLLDAAGYRRVHEEPAAVRTMTEDNARLDQLSPKQRRLLDRIIKDFFAEEEEP